MSSESQTAHSVTGQPKRSRRFIGGMLLAGSLAVGGVAWIVVANSGGSGSPSSGTSSDSQVAVGPTYTAHTACVVEVNVGLDIEHNSGYSAGPLADAVGLQNKQFELYGRMAGPFAIYTEQFGISEAETRIKTDIGNACTQASDPILTQAQLESMTQLATGTDATALQGIDVYGTN